MAEPLTTTSATALVERVRQKAVGVLLKWGTHHPLILLFGPNGEMTELTIGPMLSQPEPAKDIAIRAIKAAVEAAGAVGAITILEAWYAYIDPSEIEEADGELVMRPGHSSAAGRPERRETVLVHHQFRLAGQPELRGSWAQFFHTQDGDVVLGEAVEFPEVLEGRLSNLLG